MIVDTTVFVYSLLHVEPLHEQAGQTIDAVDRIIVPDSFWAEFTSAVWQWVRAERLSLDEALDVLDRVAAIVAEEVESKSLRERALVLAAEADHAPYDTLFAALAEQEGTQVITYDERFRQAFPDLTISPADFLA
jgi:predicted nucleic acid-binding protein